jgi:hypothetical protein
VKKTTSIFLRLNETAAIAAFRIEYSTVGNILIFQIKRTHLKNFRDALLFVIAVCVEAPTYFGLPFYSSLRHADCGVSPEAVSVGGGVHLVRSK